MIDLRKHKRVKLTSNVAKAKLNLEIHERDNYTCIVPECGGYVSINEKWHHEPCGPYKEDVIEKGCLLCYKHHQERESKNSKQIRQCCENYLEELYDERRW